MSKRVSIEELQKKKGIRTTPVSRFVFILLIVAALIAGIFAVANSVGKANELPEAEKITRSVSGKTVNEDRVDALTAATDLLVSTNAPATRAEAQAALEKMDAGDFTGFPKDFSSRILFYDSYAQNTDFQQEVGMGLFSMATIAKEFGKGEILADTSRVGTVRVDQEVGIAQVPLEIFTGQSSPVAFQMVHVDGKWLLEPHSFSTYIRLSAVLQSASS